MLISCSFHLKMRNVTDKTCTVNQNTRFVVSNFFSPEKRAVDEIMWKIILVPDRSQMKIWRIRIACWIPKATNTNINS